MEPRMMDSMDQRIPPSFHGNDFFYLAATFGSLTLVLLALAWLHRVIMEMIADPQPFWAPVSVERIVRILLMSCVVMRVTPKVVLLLQWPEISATARLAIAQADKGFDAIGIIPFAAAWLIDHLAARDLARTLKGEARVTERDGVVKIDTTPPKKFEIVPKLNDLIQPAKIAAGSFAIAFAVVYLQ